MTNPYENLLKETEERVQDAASEFWDSCGYTQKHRAKAKLDGMLEIQILIEEASQEWHANNLLKESVGYE